MPLVAVSMNIIPTTDVKIAVLTTSANGLSFKPKLKGTWTTCTSNVRYKVLGNYYNFNQCQEIIVKKNTLVEIAVVGRHSMTFVKQIQQTHCSAFPSCGVSDGSAANPSSCTCGISDCDASTGFYCFAALNKCAKAPACTNVIATIANTPCTCGLSECDGTTGVYCLSSLNKCTKKAACTITNGISANSEPCSCGTSECDASTGTYCRLDSNRCGESRLYPPHSSATFKQAALDYTNGGSSKTAAINSWGPIEEWDVSEVLDMSQGKFMYLCKPLCTPFLHHFMLHYSNNCCSNYSFFFIFYCSF